MDPEVTQEAQGGICPNCLEVICECEELSKSDATATKKKSGGRTARHSLADALPTDPERLVQLRNDGTLPSYIQGRIRSSREVTIGSRKRRATAELIATGGEVFITGDSSVTGYRPVDILKLKEIVDDLFVTANRQRLKNGKGAF